jgi:hypothetical protein
MAPPVRTRIGRFLASSIGWLLALVLPWYHLSPGLAAPVVALAGETMGLVFPWALRAEAHGVVGTLLTQLDVLVPQGGQLMAAQLTPEVNYRTFGYGAVLLWSLLLASRPPRLPRQLLLGTAALWPLQSLSLCFQWLRDVAITGGPEVLAQTGLPGWSLELIAYAYQFGFLLLTPLAPVVLWLLLDRRFVQGLWVEMSLAGTMERGVRDNDAG